MIAIPKPRKPRLTAKHQQLFIGMLPQITRVARQAFSGLDPEGKEEATAEVIAAASIGYVEARAALAAASRAGRLTARQARNARTSLDQLWSQLLIVEVTVTVVERAGDIAESERLRGYDAVHASAAIEIGADVIATADADLARAADHLGFHLAGYDEN